MKTISSGPAFLFVSLISLLHVQESPAQARADSALQLGSPVASDTSRSTERAIVPSGSVVASPTMSIPDSVRDFTDYAYTGDLFAGYPGSFTYDLASPGQLNRLMIDGLDHRRISMMVDGVPLNDPMTETFNMFLFPIEGTERIEIIGGATSFYYGLNASGAAVNFVAKDMKAIHPFTRIRYTQAPYDNTYFDGTFSQDLLRGLNITAGLFHRTNEGRFPNSQYDDWGGRVRLRYAMGDRLSIFATGHYVSTNLGLNGGVDLDASPPGDVYNRVGAIMNNTDAYEKIGRYDTRIGATARLFNDSSALTTLEGYHSTSFREYRDEENRPSPNGIFIQEDTRTQWFGVKFTQQLTFDYTLVEFGAQAERRGVIASDLFQQYVRNATSAFGKVQLQFLSIAGATLAGRYDNYLDRDLFSVGFETFLQFNKHLKVFVGGSFSHRFPSVQELHLPDTSYGLLLGDARVERHDLGEMGIAYTSDRLNFSVKYITRKSGDENIIVRIPLLSGNTLSSISTKIHGIDANIFLHVGSFALEGTGQRLWLSEYAELTHNLSATPPEWSASGGIYFWDKILGGHLNLKTGFRGRAFSSLRSVAYDPYSQIYFADPTRDIERAFALDFVLIGHVGTAHIQLIWENLFGADYVTTTFYPMNDRLIRFGISWQFLD